MSTQKEIMSPQKRLDPRIVRTRKLLRQSLIELVAERGFNDLTIQDITENATLNRTTFYLHYQDKEELLLDVFETMISVAVPLPPPPDSDQGQPFKELRPIVAVFKHIAEYADFYYAILGEQGVQGFTARVRQFIEDIIHQWMGAFLRHASKDQELPEIAIYFLGAAYVGVIVWWLENEMPCTPEEMEQHLMKLTNRGIIGLLE